MAPNNPERAPFSSEPEQRDDAGDQDRGEQEAERQGGGGTHRVTLNDVQVVSDTT